MTRIAPGHPRFGSLRTRAGLARAARFGLVVPEGLIAHGRAEAFDYLLGERTTASAARAIRIAAAWLVRARLPVVSVNGNVAALASGEVAELARRLPSLRVEVNLFHRTPGRAERVARALRAAGVTEVLGVRPTARLAGLPSDRARIDRRGIAICDVCIVPLEDGDRTAALRRAGKRVIAIDLNPLSRTALAANLTVVDELTRALRRLAEEVSRRRAHPHAAVPHASNGGLLREARAEMRRRLAATRSILPRSPRASTAGGAARPPQ
ncbi:MAG TPA: phosphopantothenate/pantothenate synthetase [Thermoplasmata archaeon]|nr:phosphopantothenate/pantothenate synthetase [Thermoplasmata archaeon]